MRKIILSLLISLAALPVSYAQKVVETLSDVKNPKQGKLYYSKSENKLTIYEAGKFQMVFTAEKGEVTPPEGSEIRIGYWEYQERRLEAWKFIDGYFLIQTDGTYVVPRGKNLLWDKKTKITSDFDISKIRSTESEIGGLKPPSNFPTKELISKGYKLNSNGEFIKGDIDPEPEKPVPGEPVGLKSIPNYPKPNRLNYHVLDQFPDFDLPKNLVNVAGHGFPLYKDEPTGKDGKLKLFNIGFTNATNLEAFDRSKWADKDSKGQWFTDRHYYFQQAHHLIRESLKNMQTRYKPEWGTINLSGSGGDIDYTGLTIEGVKECGRGFVGAAKSLDNQLYNIDTRASVLMIDEESISSQRWQGGGHYEFLGYLQQGINEASQGRQKVFLYAQPISTWFKELEPKFDGLSDAELMEFLNPSNIKLGKVWDDMRWYLDANGGYYKTPFLSKINLYQTDSNGNYILKDGKRVYRDDNTTIPTFLSTTKILRNPEDKLKWFGTIDATGRGFHSWQDAWGKYDSWDLTFNRPKGYTFNPLSQTYRPGWKSDYNLFVNNMYSKADLVMQDLLLLAYKEKGNYNITDPNKNYLLYVEHRPVTEPYTANGNSTEVREIGESAIFYDTFMNLYFGVKGLSTWDDGRHFGSIEAKNGEALYWDDIEHTRPDGSKYYTRDYKNSDWSRYHARVSAFQEALKDLQGTDALKWKHIHFYYPYLGRKYSHVISGGIHYNGKLHIFFLNPSLENGEKQDLTLKIGATEYNLTLDGHEFYYQTFDAPDGLSPKDFTLEYTTILGKKTKVTGLVTNNLKDHYLY